MNANSVETVIFKMAHALLVPVLVCAVLAVAVVLVEMGRLCTELYFRRKRSQRVLESTSNAMCAAIRAGRVDEAVSAGNTIAPSRAVATAMRGLVELAAQPDEPLLPERSAKLLADFDYGSVRRLERTRILVRLGPALGLMGTLIPLSPALAALAKGDVATLSSNLRVAFSVTILGLAVGAVSFAISLVRDRLYSQDLSDLEFVAAALGTVRDSAPEAA
jgi:biopolymer transport protein ExbB/TolQ